MTTLDTGNRIETMHFDKIDYYVLLDYSLYNSVKNNSVDNMFFKQQNAGENRFKKMYSYNIGTFSKNIFQDN